MKILMSSYAFHPSVGGIEAVSAMLAEKFVETGHELRLVTLTPSSGKSDFPFEIVRRPTPAKLVDIVRWSDVVLHINISLRTGWPLLFGKKPWVIAHHTWITEDFRGSIKRRCAQSAHNISISEAVATHLRVPSTLIPNPYDDDVFREFSDQQRDQDLIFVGRLVSQKGVDCLLSALHLLKQRGVTPNLTIVGAGPEERRLQKLAAELKLNDQIDFIGVKVGRELANELGRHKILVLPTLIHEPFGVVALEAIASGCVVVGSRGGGLKDAIGPCGVTFPNGNSQALADLLSELLSDEATLRGYRQNAAAHLSRHTKARVASKYLSVVQTAVHWSHKVAGTVAVNEDGC